MEVVVIIGGLLAFGVCLYLVRGKRRTSRPEFLDTPLLFWPGGDAFTIRDLLNGGIAIFGRSGGGKTSGPGRRLLSAIIAAHCGGLILAVKPEDLQDTQDIFRKAGRLHDLIVVNLDGVMQCNVLDCVRAMGGGAREITKAITTIGENLRSNDSRGGENADFFENEKARVIHNAVECVRLGTGRVGAPELQQFISTAAMSPEQLRSDEWKGEYHNQVMQKAYLAPKTTIEQHDFELAADYWFSEFPNMASRTRSSILVGVYSILHVFNSGVCRSIVSAGTNFSPVDMLVRKKWVFANAPPSLCGDVGRLLGGSLKYITQVAVLRRHARESDPFHVIWCDEYYQWATLFDSFYLAQCRSHLGCQVILNQSLHSLFAAAHGEAGQHQVLGLLSNFSTKIFNALGSEQDAKYASGLIGNSLETFVGGSVQPPKDLYDLMTGVTNYSSSFSEHYEPTIKPQFFLNGLRTGGKANGNIVDGILIKSGEPFKDGNNYKFVSFQQE
jgi:hypothetical protein